MEIKMELLSKVAKWVREVREKEIAQAKRHEEIELERMRKDSVTLGLEFHKKFRQLDLYPGPLSEYSSLRGKECEIVDTGGQNKEVTIQFWWNPTNRIHSSVDYWDNYQTKGRLERVIADGQFYKRLLEQGVCGLIHGHWAGRYEEICYVGVPVREKKLS